jgi:hypothetical protein
MKLQKKLLTTIAVAVAATAVVTTATTSCAFHQKMIKKVDDRFNPKAEPVVFNCPGCGMG